MNDLNKAIHTIAKITEQTTTQQTPSTNKLMITTCFNLRGIQSKVEVLENTPLCTGWMAFVNNACTLAHVMHPDDIDSYVRIKLQHGLKGANEEYIRSVIYNRMKTHYIF